MIQLAQPFSLPLFTMCFVIRGTETCNRQNTCNRVHLKVGNNMTMDPPMEVHGEKNRLAVCDDQGTAIHPMHNTNVTIAYLGPA